MEDFFFRKAVTQCHYNCCVKFCITRAYQDVAISEFEFVDIRLGLFKSANYNEIKKSEFFRLGKYLGLNGRINELMLKANWKDEVKNKLTSIRAKKLFDTCKDLLSDEELKYFSFGLQGYKETRPDMTDAELLINRAGLGVYYDSQDGYYASK